MESQPILPGLQPDASVNEDAAKSQAVSFVDGPGNVRFPIQNVGYRRDSRSRSCSRQGDRSCSRQVSRSRSPAPSSRADEQQNTACSQQPVRAPWQSLADYNEALNEALMRAQETQLIAEHNLSSRYRGELLIKAANCNIAKGTVNMWNNAAGGSTEPAVSPLQFSHPPDSSQLGEALRLGHTNNGEGNTTNGLQPVNDGEGNDESNRQGNTV